MKSKQAMFKSIDALCAEVHPGLAVKTAEDGPTSSAPGASGGAENEVSMHIGELGKEVSNKLKERVAATESAPDAKTKGPEEQQLMIGHESHQVDQINLPIGSQAKDPGTESPVEVGGEKYAKLSFAQARDAATKIANEYLKSAASDSQAAPGAVAKLAAAHTAGQQAATQLLARKREIVKAAVQQANSDADLVIGFLLQEKKAAEEEEALEGGEGGEGGGNPEEAAAPPSDGGGPPPGDAGGGDPLAGLLPPGPGEAPPPPPGGDGGMPGGLPGGMPGGMPGGPGGDMPPGMPGAGGGEISKEEVIQQLLALLAEPGLGQLAASGEEPVQKVAAAVGEYLKAASPAQLKIRESLRKDLRSYVREVA